MGSAKGVLDSGVKQILMQNFGALSGVHGGLVSAAESRGLKSILVTSSNRGEGKTVTAIGMAYALAGQANAKVLLVDGNFPAPAIHDRFGVPRQPGLSEYLTTDVGLEEVVCPTDESDLMLLPIGGAATTLPDVTRAPSFPRRFAALADRFDYVICDCASIFGASDPTVLASRFDGTVLVVECERTRWEVVQDAKERISKTGGRILGVVLNRRKFYIPQALYQR